MTESQPILPHYREGERKALLKDGTSIRLRPAYPDDVDALMSFFEQLSPRSLRKRFMRTGTVERELVESLCRDPGEDRGVTLLALRGRENDERILGVGSYLVENRRDDTAEIAFAVDDTFQGKGIGTLLLERLALRAVQAGIRTFLAVTRADNNRMIQVFESSGFSTRTDRDREYVIVELDVRPDREGLKQVDLRDRVSTVASLRSFFRPDDVAVIGASRERDSIGYRILKELKEHDFRGAVYPVNPNAETVQDMQSYPSVTELPGDVDLAVVVVPSSVVPEVIEDCAEAGIRSLIVISAGFAEVGEEGRKRQEQVLEIVRSSGMRMIGPNCLGLINANPEISLNASFSPVFPDFGSVAMLSQSGALGLAILQLARDRELGLSSFVSVGNKADVSGNDLLQYWEEDADTDVILLYLESFGNPRRFGRISRRISRRKPIVAVKGGKTGAGERAASSHTAALADSQAGVEALFKQTGVLRVDDLEEMFDLAAALSHQPLPSGRNVGIVTNSGGPGILCTDACETNNLNVPEFDGETKDALRDHLPEEASVLNPVDMVASAGPDAYRTSVETVLSSDAVDALFILYIPVSEGRSGKVIRAIKEGVRAGREQDESGKPVMVCQVAEERQKRLLDTGEERIPSYLFPETPALVLSEMADYAEWLEKPQGRMPDFDGINETVAMNTVDDIIENRTDEWLSTGASRELLEAFGFPIANGDIASGAEDAATLAERIGFPVALKLSSREVVHKTDVGGVELGLESPGKVQEAYRRIERRMDDLGKSEAMEGVLVQEMVEEGTEILIGVESDPQFGHLIAFGLGGIFVEVMSDVTIRIAPLTDRDAEEMMDGINSARTTRPIGNGFA